MPSFPSYDGLRLTYHEKGAGDPLICVPGGPFRASEYLGDIGGLAAHRRLILLDIRGTGESEVPTNQDTYLCINLVRDLEALREHLGLDTVDLLGHSAGANVVALYAARHPERVSRMVMVTPGWRATNLVLPNDEWFAAMRRRSGEPWFDEAFAAMTRLDLGELTEENFLAAAPLVFGRWTDAARELTESQQSQLNRGARIWFLAEGSFGNWVETRNQLRGLTAPVLLLGGDLDPSPTTRLLREYLTWFPNGRLLVQPEA